MKIGGEKVPRTSFKITGDIKDFERLDNLYRKLKSEGEKLLDNWQIEMSAEYTETSGESEIPR